MNYFEIKESIEYSDKTIEFAKIYIPWDLLAKYAEILDFRLPVKVVLKNSPLHPLLIKWNTKLIGQFLSSFEFLQIDSYNEEEAPFLHRFACLRKLYYLVQPPLPKPNKYLTNIFRRSQTNKFIPSNLYPAYVSNTLRQTAVYEILQTVGYDPTDRNRIGIARMLREHIFHAAYPLHESGHLKNELNVHWAKFANFYRAQPLNSIRDYFGENFGLYFAWLGTYTTWLLVPALAGIVVFLCGLNESFSSELQANSEICDAGRSIEMCPICEVCPRWNLSSICEQSRATAIFDNHWTVIYSVFMSLWCKELLSLSSKWN
jgi:hypothetical protein